MTGACEYCKREYRKRVSKQRFCSLQCARHVTSWKLSDDVREQTRQSRMISPKLGHKIDMVCDGCGKTFREYASRRPRPMKFCTRQCGLDWQQGKLSQEADTEPILPIDRKQGMTLVLVNGEIKQV